MVVYTTEASTTSESSRTARHYYNALFTIARDTPPPLKDHKQEILSMFMIRVTAVIGK